MRICILLATLCAGCLQSAEVVNATDYFNRAGLTRLVGFELTSWNRAFGWRNTFTPPALVAFKLHDPEDRMPSPCGRDGSGGRGAFYCPVDNRVYFDVQYLQYVKAAVAAANHSSGRYVSAAILAHEIGHAVSYGLWETGRFFIERMPLETANLHRMETTADCLAGVITGTAVQQGLMTESDVKDAETALLALGDRDTANGVHGAPLARQANFRKGYEHGVGACNAFFPWRLDQTAVDPRKTRPPAPAITDLATDLTFLYWSSATNQVTK